MPLTINICHYLAVFGISTGSQYCQGTFVCVNYSVLCHNVSVTVEYDSGMMMCENLLYIWIYVVIFFFFRSQLIYRRFCRSLFGSNYSRSTMRAKTDVCQQWTWLASLQTWDTDYGKKIEHLQFYQHHRFLALISE